VRLVVANAIIKRAESDEYVALRGWSPLEREALVFQSSLAALDYCCQKRLTRAVIVLRFRQPRLNIELHPFAHLTVDRPVEVGPPLV
jgi:hypothetical protein